MTASPCWFSYPAWGSSRQTAANTHPHWQAELARLGRNKAIVAIARKLLIAVWFVLTQQVADRFTQPEWVARKLLKYAHRLGKSRRPQGLSASAFVRLQLNRLAIGQNLTQIRWGKSKRSIPLLALPPTQSAGSARH
jgi:hypothetical protein